MDIELAQALAENKLLKSLLYCTKRSCNNCGKVNCENFQRQRKDCCENWISYIDYIKKLEAQIEKLIDFIISKTECCDVCPITDTCINNEGTCPYAGILSKGEEEVTREWLMQFISKEIKEK